MNATKMKRIYTGTLVQTKNEGITYSLIEVRNCGLVQNGNAG